MADVVSKPQKTSSENANPNKFFTHFLYKAAIVTLLLVLLPLFPSLAPEFINQTLHARSWEFLQLIFVGIAVSYGLFSTRNDVEETHKDSTKALDNAQSYVSKLLQVPSVFDDESEHQTDDVADENSKVQTWSSQYYREEPAIKVAKETSLINSEINQKPLLLPVRSLKQRVIEDETDRKADDNGGKIIGKSNSKRFSRAKIGEIEVGGVNLEKENVVLRSPIPWRSRSGRFEINEERNSDNNNNNNNNNNEFIFSPSIELNSRSFRASRPNLSSFESQSKSSEDVVKKKNLSSPPPPPPPPPPPSRFLRKSSSSVMRSSNERVLRRSVRSVPLEDFSESEMEDPPRVKTGNGSRPVRMFKKSFDDYHEMNVVDQKVVMDSSDDDSGGESEEDVISTNVVDDHSDDNSNSNENENENENDSVVNNGGPDVDKKADEFIAKFREQIRLQRIESIRRSTAQRAGKTTSR